MRSDLLLGVQMWTSDIPAIRCIVIRMGIGSSKHTSGGVDLRGSRVKMRILLSDCLSLSHSSL